MRKFPYLVLFVLLALMGACGDDNNNNNDQCPDGQVRDGDRCVFPDMVDMFGDSDVTDMGDGMVDMVPDGDVADTDGGGDMDTDGGNEGLYVAIDFDDPAETYLFLGFEGAEDSSVQPDPTDAGNNAARVNRFDTAATFAGTVFGTSDGPLIPVIPFDANNTIVTVRTLAPVTGATVRLALENSTDGMSSQVVIDATTTVADSFETLTFDFGPVVDLGVTYDKAIIFFNFGVDGATAGAQTWYFDDFDFIGGGGIPMAGDFVTIDFENDQATFTDFGGAASSAVEDPGDAGNTVARFLRTANAETFAGTTVVTRPNDTVGVIPFDADNTRMSVRVYSPAPGIPVLLKVEDSRNGMIASEVSVATTTAGAFETLTFDFANGTPLVDPTQTYDKLNIFMNFGLAMGAEQEFFFDDMTFIGGGGLPMITAFVDIDFENSQATFADFGGAATTDVTDPTDAGNTVAEFTRTANAETFAGTTVVTAAGNTVGDIPFDAMNTRFSVRVWSPAANVPVLLKVEDVANSAIFSEVTVNTTQAMAWETLTFEFAGGVPALDVMQTYNRLSIFFNFGLAMGAEEIYYFDDINFIGGTGMMAMGTGVFAPVVDFSEPTLTVFPFNGLAVQSIVDPMNAMNSLGEFTRPDTAALDAGSVVGTNAMGLVSPLPFASDATKMTMRISSPVIGAPVLLKIEQSGGGLPIEVTQNTTTDMGYETLTFDFAGQIDPMGAYDRIVVFPNFQVDNMTTEVYLIDDISLEQTAMMTMPVFVSADTADAVVEQNGNVADLVAGGASIGDRAAGSVYVIPFQLPAIPMGGFTSATLDVYLDNVVVNDAGNPVELDLYGLPSAAAPTVLGSMYYSGPTPDMNATLVAQGVASNGTSAMTALSITDPALLAYINDEITSNNAVAGDYVFLRFGPDLVAPMAAATTFIFTTQEGGPPANLPTLTLQ